MSIAEVHLFGCDFTVLRIEVGKLDPIGQTHFQKKNPGAGRVQLLISSV